MLVRNPESYSSLDDEQLYAERAGDRGHASTAMWRALRWNWRLIAVFVLAALLLAAAFLTLIPATYRATAVVLVDPRQPRVTNTETVLSGIGADAAAVESQVELIESSTLAGKVISKLDLAADPHFSKPSLSEVVLGALGIGTGTDGDDRHRNRLIYRFQSGLTVRRRGLTYVLEISYAAPDAAKAAKIANAVADAYLDDQRATRLEITSRAAGWLGGRIEGLRDQVRKAEQAVADYKAENSIVGVTQGNRLISKQIEDLTQQLALARSRSADAKAKLERAEQVAKRTADPAELAEALQSNVISNLRSQYAEAARLQAEYSALYGSRHPSLIAVSSQLTNIRRQIDQELARIVAGMRNDYSVAESREKSLERELERLVNESAAATHADVRLHELEREAQAARALFEQFLARAGETKEQQSLQIAEARIISPALVPIRPTRPSLALLLVAAAGTGGVAGVGMVLLKEQLRRGVRAGHEIERYFSLPCLATLPSEPRSSAPSHIVPPASPYAASLNSIRARLRHHKGSPCGQVLLVMSALQNEGKSTFACNFALAAASSGTRTLLIDGDAVTASVTKGFDIKGPGLWQVLKQEVSVWDAVRRHLHSRMFVMGARDTATAPKSPSDVAEAIFHNVMDELRNHFDLIVIDTPPLLSSTGGHLPFIESADCALLIIEWDRTDRQAVEEALSLLGPQVNKVAGGILNKVPAEWHRLFDNRNYLTGFSAEDGRSESPPLQAFSPASKHEIADRHVVPAQAVGPARQNDRPLFRL